MTTLPIMAQKNQTKGSKQIEDDADSACASTSDSVSIIQESLELFQNNFDSKLDEKFTDFSQTLKNDIAKTIDAAVSKAVQKQLGKFRAAFREEINRLSERLVAVEMTRLR